MKQEWLDLLRDKFFRLNNLYMVTDKTGKKVRFRLTQDQLDYYNGLHNRNLILKARQLGFCLAPETRVLTADLRWVPIGELKAGDEVVACDEHAPGGKGQARRMRTATVQAAVQVYRPAYRVTFDDGRSVVCTDQHPWLAKMAGPKIDWRSISGNGNSVIGKLYPGVMVKWITKPWGDSSFDDGWMGGMLDGEGSIKKANTPAGLCVAQLPGPASARMEMYLHQRGYNYRTEDDQAVRLTKYGKAPVPKLCIGRMDEMFRLLGQTRPTRFIGNRFWEGRELPGKKTGVGWSTVTSVVELDQQIMIDLQTSTGTYIAEGFVSHNTTLQCIIQLDAALFESAKCALIAHTLPDAHRLFREKVKFAYDNLPDEIKKANPARNDSAGELVFSKGGSLYVSTSFRGGTLRYLHVSEFGKICAKYPHKAREIVTGAFEAVAADCFITIESTAEGRAGYFFDYSDSAEKHQIAGRPLGRLDWKFFFFSWWRNAGYAEPVLAELPQRLTAYFTALEQKHGVITTLEQRAWYWSKEKTLGDDMKREYPSIPAEAFQQSVEGAYYARQFAKIYEQKRITKLPDNSHQPVHTFWDIGVGDQTSIWFVREIGEEYHIVDFYENSGEGLRHYMKVIKDKGYKYGEHWGPHDIENRELGSDAKSRKDLAREGYEIDGKKYTLNFKVVPRTGVDDGIEAVREILPHCYFDESKTEVGVKALENYRKEWDDKRGCWKDKPLHDWSSDAADSFRYFAVAKKRRKFSLAGLS